MRAPPHATTDGDAADFYVVPFLSKCFYNFAANYRLDRMDRELRAVIQYLDRSPWWRRRPERHLFFFMSGIGAGIVPSWHTYLSRAIFIVAEGDREASYFREGHDIVVPGKVSTSHLARQRPPSKRRYLGVFRGSLDAALRDDSGGRVRQKNRLRRKLHRVLADERAVIFSSHKSRQYVDEMDNSRFCIIPRGNTPWTRRFFDAVVRGCIPAVLSNPVTFPFERLLDFRQITLKLPEHWAPHLAAELRHVNESSALALHSNLGRLWPAFVYKDGCAYEMLLLELAARKLNLFSSYPSATPNSLHSFWSPARGSFRMPYAVKVGPSWGAGAKPH